MKPTSIPSYITRLSASGTATTSSDKLKEYEGRDVVVSIVENRREVLLTSLGLPPISAVPANQESLDRWGRLAAAGASACVWVEAVDIGSSDSPRLSIHTQGVIFTDRRDVGEVGIMVDDSAMESIKRVHAAAKNPLQWLAEEFLLQTSQSQQCSALIVLFSNEDAEPEGEDSKVGGFRLIGRTYQADVERCKGDGDDYFAVRRVSSRRSKVVPRSWGGMIRFVENTVQARARAQVSLMLANSEGPLARYLATWKEYDLREKSAAATAMRRFGVIRYNKVQPRSGGWYALTPTKEIREHVALLEEGSYKIIAAAEEQSVAHEIEFLTDPNKGWEILTATRKGGSRSRPVGVDEIRPIKRGAAEIFVKAESEPPTVGLLYADPVGDAKRFGRRDKAMEAIRSGTNPMPQVAVLLGGSPAPVRRDRSEVEPLSPSLLGDVFKKPPTLRQIEAVSIALNTPDIALIQGPPGTGKSTVIAAIVRRAAELQEAGEITAGRILVSAYQHDAVEELIGRINVNGLRPIKVGTKRGAEDDSSGSESIRALRGCIEEWLDGIDTPSTPAVVAQLRAVIQSYASSPGGHSGACATIDTALRIARQFQNCRPYRQLAAMRQRFGMFANQSVVADEPAGLWMARSIRVTRTSFEDDGRQSARRVLEQFAELLDVESRQVLIQAVERGGPLSDSLLSKLQRIRESLLEQLIPPAVIGDERADEELLQTLSALRDEVTIMHSGSAKEQLADAQYRLRVEALESPAGLRRALEQYSVVYAATCGQATKDEMARLKVGSGAGPEIIFDSVLVDEAARAAPFDLFIPISLAARRIILVGDQMQLPHFLDQELAEQVETADAIAAVGTDDSVTRHLKESLFQRLYERLRELEKTDGIQRVVTLDTQYRMHPDLGTFVSKCFYENQPTPTTIVSGRIASDFAHALPGYVGVCAAWLDVPAKTADDHEKSEGTSKHRKCESHAIATDLQRLAGTLEGQRMTYGIIAGYSAQVDAIKEGIQSNGWQLNGEDLCKDGIRIAVRVGTVDAFQGREFDVVYFSMTRSNALPSGTEDERRKKYGHLLFPNRLCVALSRQKRLLIVVGNSEMIAAPEPETLEALSPLIEFRKLCGGANG